MGNQMFVTLQKVFNINVKGECPLENKKWKGKKIMIMKKEDIFSIKKDGNFYRVYRKRTRIGKFLLLSDAEKYFEKRIIQEQKKH